MEISDPKNDKIFKVKGKRFNPFIATDLESNANKVMGLYDPFYK